jgi:hypothetical protein
MRQTRLGVSETSCLSRSCCCHRYGKPLLVDFSALDDTDLLACPVAEVADLPELATIRTHIARLKLRVRTFHMDTVKCSKFSLLYLG